MYKQKQTYRYREQTCSCQGGGGGGEKDWEFRINRPKTYLIIAKANIYVS